MRDLTLKEEIMYDRVISLINQYCYDMARAELIETLDELVETIMEEE